MGKQQITAIAMDYLPNHVIEVTSFSY